MSWAAQSAVTGGQLMTGHVALPDRTGPNPLLLPAMAMNTAGIPSPKRFKNKVFIATFVTYLENTLNATN